LLTNPLVLSLYRLAAGRDPATDQHTKESGDSRKNNLK
jgi:hypothetical protein